jgi:hypothetical protein
MLKKAGIIVAAAATGVLALSSLAFADEETGNLGNDCAFGNAGGSPEAGAFGGSSLVGTLAGLVTSAASGVTTQANTLNCNNLQFKDLVDSGSNNETATVTEQELVGRARTASVRALSACVARSGCAGSARRVTKNRAHPAREAAISPDREVTEKLSHPMVVPGFENGATSI